MAESDLDVIELPGYPGMFARRITVKRWQAAGSPKPNSALRLYDEQLRLRLLFEAGKGSPADDPRYPGAYKLAHVRGIALDIDPTPERVRRLAAAGLVRPYDYEPWHWQEPGSVYSYPLVTQLPAPASVKPPVAPTLPEPEEEDEGMTINVFRQDPGSGEFLLVDPSIGQDIVQYREGEALADGVNARFVGDVKIARGFAVTTNVDIGGAWAALVTKTKSASSQAWTVLQAQASLLAVEAGGDEAGAYLPPKA